MRVKLEDVCERGTSSLMQKDIVDKNGKYPVYGASGRIGSMETYQQEHQTVAVVKDGAGIGRTMLLPEKSSVIGTMQYLIPKNCIESEYLYYVVKYMHLEKYFQVQPFRISISGITRPRNLICMIKRNSERLFPH